MMRVLVVDDCPMVSEALAEHLLRRGFDAHTAECVNQGVDEASKAHATGTPYDVVVSDINMPDGTGFDLAQRLRSIGLNPRFVFMSAVIDQWKRDRAVGFDAEIFDKMDFTPIYEALVKLFA